MGKMKVHELAKELNLTSKEVIERASKLGIELKSHLSSLEDGDIERIKENLGKAKSVEIKKVKEAPKKEKQEAAPVIIRRAVIISDDEINKKEEEEKRRIQEQRKNNIGIVERKQNKDFNIVYRNKPSKPMTVNELFGIKPAKKEEPPKQEEIKKVEIETKEKERKIH